MIKFNKRNLLRPGQFLRTLAESPLLASTGLSRPMLHFSPADLPCWTEQPGSADLLGEQMLDPTIELFDAVRITELRQPVNSDLGKGDIRKPEVGDVAWVIEIYEKPPGYELECSDKNGITEWLHLFSPDEIKFEKVVKL